MLHHSSVLLADDRVAEAPQAIHRGLGCPQHLKPIQHGDFISVYLIIVHFADTDIIQCPQQNKSAEKMGFGLANLPRSKEGAQLLLFYAPRCCLTASAGFGRRFAKSPALSRLWRRYSSAAAAQASPDFCSINHQLTWRSHESGDAAGARSSRQAASYVIFCP